jgi:predicted DNA-binding transcriptional regulator AlpA
LNGTLTLGELRALPATIDLPTAARALGMGRTKAYELAKRGRFPCRVLRIGSAYRIPTAELLHCLGMHPGSTSRPASCDHLLDEG